MKNVMARFIREDEGQDLIEYSLLCALIAVASIAAMTALGTSIVGIFNYIAGQLPPNVGG
jgi:pilus assembly protein Flp/PilA